MKSIKNSLYAFAGLGLIMGIITFFSQTRTDGQESTGPTRPVIVVNDPAGPVPVTGTVNVGNFATGPLSVRNLDEPGRSPYQENQVIQPNSSVTTFTTVPAGKRLIVKRVSGRLFLPNGTALLYGNLFSGDTEGNVSAQNYFRPVFTVSASPTDYYVVNEELLAYIDEGRRPMVLFGRFDGQTLVRGQISLSGYYIDVP